MSESNLSLPEGWVQQHDPKYDHPYWVDTRANPPRSIWVHPYEDEQFLVAHPEAKAKKGDDRDDPPPYEVATGDDEPSTSTQSPKDSHVDHGRGVFGKLKDKAIGTKEEREEHGRIKAERDARAREQARKARQRELAEREAYMREHGGYAPYRPSYPQRQRSSPDSSDSDVSGFLVLPMVVLGLSLLN